MVVTARSKSVLGPWGELLFNPLVHTYSEREKLVVQGTRHTDRRCKRKLVGGVPAYAKVTILLGRQTLSNRSSGHRTDGVVPSPQARFQGRGSIRHGLEPDDFQGTELGLQWTFWKEYAPKAVTLENRTLRLKAKGKTPADGRLLLATAEDRTTKPKLKSRSGKTIQPDSCFIIVKSIRRTGVGRQDIHRLPGTPDKEQNCPTR